MLRMRRTSSLLMTRARLLLSAQQQSAHANRLSVLARALHSSSNAPRPLERGLAHLLSSCGRAFDRRDTYLQYKAQQLFSPVPVPLRDVFNFVRLESPQRTRIDLSEFLTGAAVAGREQLMAVNSRAFARFAVGDEPLPGLTDVPLDAADSSNSYRGSTDPTDDSDHAVAAFVESICCPHMFRGVRSASERALRERNLLIEIKELRIDKIFVTSVEYSQLSEVDYAALLEGKRSLSDPWSLGDDAAIEHVAIRVAAQTTETHRMTVLGDEVALVEQQNFRQWVFESRVTSPDDLDWRLLVGHGINNSARELAPRTYLQEEKGMDAK